MDIVKETRDLLAARPRGMSYRRIATDTGLGFDWLAKFAIGGIQEPGGLKLAILRDYLLRTPASGMGNGR